jgi:hypothetical protein
MHVLSHGATQSVVAAAGHTVSAWHSRQICAVLTLQPCWHVVNTTTQVQLFCLNKQMHCASLHACLVSHLSIRLSVLKSEDEAIANDSQQMPAVRR